MLRTRVRAQVPDFDIDWIGLWRLRMERPTPEESSEKSSSGATRRELFQIGNVLALPVLLSAFEAEAAPAPGPLKTGPGMEIYQSIGVERVINCRCTFTIICASLAMRQVRP